MKLSGKLLFCFPGGEKWNFGGKLKVVLAPFMDINSFSYIWNAWQIVWFVHKSMFDVKYTVKFKNTVYLLNKCEFIFWIYFKKFLMSYKWYYKVLYSKKSSTVSLSCLCRKRRQTENTGNHQCSRKRKVCILNNIPKVLFFRKWGERHSPPRTSFCHSFLFLSMKWYT